MTLREKNKVLYLYFILSVLVILIHSINNATKFEMFFSIEKGIGQFAVPLFFYISGFLFFRTAYSIDDVKRKLKKRVYTLLIPYLIWNLIYYAIKLLFNPGSGISMMSILDAAFNHTYNPAFWFMYQLILLNILSPLFFKALKNRDFIIIFYAVLVALIIFAVDLPYINEDAMIYYFSGAVFSKLYNRGKVSFISKKYALYMILVSAVMYILNRFCYAHFLKNLFTLSIILVRLTFSIFIFYFVDIFFKYEKTYSFMEHTFFLYAIHYMIVKAMIMFMRFISIKILPANYLETIEIITFILSPIVSIIINIYLVNFLRKHFNKAYRLLSGDR